jgi:hypothetical protein
MWFMRKRAESGAYFSDSTHPSEQAHADQAPLSGALLATALQYRTEW